MQSVHIATKVVSVLDTTFCDKVCQQLAVGRRWVSSGAPVSSTNKSDHHDITEILLKVVLSAKAITLPGLSFLGMDYGCTLYVLCTL